MRMQNTQLAATAERAQIWRNAMHETGEIYRQSYENHQRVQDRLSEQFSQMIRGRETFTDPNTHESVELPVGYRNVYSNNRGEYLLTDSSENPNATDPDRRDWTLQLRGSPPQ